VRQSLSTCCPAAYSLGVMLEGVRRGVVGPTDEVLVAQSLRVAPLVSFALLLAIHSFLQRLCVHGWPILGNRRLESDASVLLHFLRQPSDHFFFRERFLVQSLNVRR